MGNHLSKSLVRKGFGFTAISSITKGLISKLFGRGVSPLECDYDAGTKLATRGFLGAAIGIPTRGRVLRICIEEIPEIPPLVIRVAGGGSKPYTKKKKKCLLITVEAYGKTYKKEECVYADRNVKIKDIDVIDDGEKIISIQVKGIK